MLDNLDDFDRETILGLYMSLSQEEGQLKGLLDDALATNESLMEELNKKQKIILEYEARLAERPLYPILESCERMDSHSLHQDNPARATDQSSRIADLEARIENLSEILVSQSGEIRELQDLVHSLKLHILEPISAEQSF